MAAQPKNENPILHRENARKVKEHYVSGEHMAIDDLKKNDVMKQKENKKYIGQRLAKPTETAKFKVPHYPRPVEFHCSSVSHVTTTKGMKGILKQKGFKGKDRRPGKSDRRLLWWGTVIGESEITTAEERYLEKIFPAWSPEERRREEGFLCEFTTSPVFKERSRYGNFRFTFSLADVMSAYRSQFCDEKEPVLRVYETVFYKQEVMYVVLIHSPDVHDYDGYPELGDKVEGVCAYRDGEIIWRAQAISQTHSYRMIENRVDRQVNVEGGFNVFYVWDHVTLAFLMPKGRHLVFPLGTLQEALTACGGAVNSLNDVIGKVKAEKIVQEIKDNAKLSLKELQEALPACDN